MKSFEDWLREAGLERYASVFAENDIDFSIVRKLTESDLKELGLTLGHRKKFLEALAVLDSQAEPALAIGQAQPLSSTTEPSGGERRQLTVMFCDLVGSTALSERLDPEELRALLHEYRMRCGEVIARYDGHVARYVGDGILTYFGWPKAHEEDAERSVRAALEIVQAMKGMSFAEPLSVRIGIATGPVVVGEQAGEGDQAKLAVGSTPNLAARLQGLASADQIVIASSTRRLIGDTFELYDLGQHALKGISEPVRAWRIEDVSEASSRFEASHGAQLTPLVGREQEIGLLLDRWQLSREGEGQVVLLCGEPGIGKSRILSALRERLERQGAGTLRLQCSPYHVNRAFWPSMDNFERALKFARDETSESKLDKLEALVVDRYGRPVEDVRFIASILSIPCDERYGALAMTAQKYKDETVRALVDLTEAAARRGPRVMLFEDLQWADPATLEVLDLMIDRVRSIPLLIVLTHRPEFQSRWSRHGHVTGLNLSKLTRAQSGAMVSKLAGGKTLPSELLEQMLAKTDGVPLFVEELSKSILESGELKDAGEHYEYKGNVHTIAIPATLRDSLMARLDRVIPVKEIAQIGAAIGREFSHELIAAVAPMAQAQLDAALAQLTESGLAFRRGTPPDAVYTFKHALVQDAAYDSLLKTRRLELHGSIAAAIERLHAGRPEEQAPLLAYHYERNERYDRAMHYALAAGDRAAQQLYANAEAASYYERALGMARSMPPSPDAERAQIDAMLKLAGVEVMRKDLERERANLQHIAATLAEKLDDRARLSKVYYWLGRIEYTLGNPQGATEHARRSLEVAEGLGDEALAAAPANLLGRACFLQGNCRDAGELLERSAAQLLKLGNVNDAATSAAFAGTALAELGQFERAALLIDQGMRLARENPNPFVEAAVLFFRGTVRYARGEWEGALHDVAESKRIAQPVGDLFRVFIASCWGGVAYIGAGDLPRARAELEDALALGARLGTRFMMGRAKAWYAECLVRLGEPQAAIASAREGIRLAEELNDQLASSLAHRALAHALFRHDRSNWTQVEDLMRTAIQVQQDGGLRPGLARTYALYAAMLSEMGEAQRADELRAKATRMASEMGMVVLELEPVPAANA